MTGIRPVFTLILLFRNEGELHSFINRFYSLNAGVCRKRVAYSCKYANKCHRLDDFHCRIDLKGEFEKMRGPVAVARRVAKSHLYPLWIPTAMIRPLTKVVHSRQGFL